MSILSLSFRDVFGNPGISQFRAWEPHLEMESSRKMEPRLSVSWGGGAQQMANPRASLSQHLKSASLQHNMASQKPLPLPSMPACAGMPPPSPLYSEWPNKPPNPEANTGFRHSVLGDLLQSEF